MWTLDNLFNRKTQAPNNCVNALSEWRDRNMVAEKQSLSVADKKFFCWRSSQDWRIVECLNGRRARNNLLVKVVCEKTRLESSEQIKLLLHLLDYWWMKCFKASGTTLFSVSSNCCTGIIISIRLKKWQLLTEINQRVLYNRFVVLLIGCFIPCFSQVEPYLQRAPGFSRLLGVWSRWGLELNIQYQRLF